MTFYQSIFNGSKVVQRQVKRKGKTVSPGTDSAEKQTGGAIVELKKLPGPAKEQDKKAIRLKMAQELMKTL